MPATMIDQTCENCGTFFQRRKGHEKEHPFCSRKCYWKSDYRSQLVAAGNAGRNPEAHVTEPCGFCGTSVTRYASSRGKTLYCNTACHANAKRRAQVRQVTSSGYVRIFVGIGYPGASKSGHVFEHRKVMQDSLGRALTQSENVHHINGQRADNRIENLELWSTSQPQGQRVEDKIRWAKGFLALYERDSEQANVEVQEPEYAGRRFGR